MKRKLTRELFEQIKRQKKKRYRRLYKPAQKRSSSKLAAANPCHRGPAQPSKNGLGAPAQMKCPVTGDWVEAEQLDLFEAGPERPRAASSIPDLQVDAWGGSRRRGR